MKVSLEKEGKNVVRLDVELEADRATKAYEQAIRSLSHKLNIPGFRRGKAPRKIVEKAVGVDYVKREALEKLLPELLGEAISKENLDVITEPSIESYDFELGTDLKIKAKLEIRPEVQLGDYSKISINVPQAQMPDDALDRALNQIADSKATHQSVDPRPVKMGDTVLLDFECLVDGKPVDGGKAQGLVLEIKEGTFIPGFCEKIVGHKPVEKFDVQVKFPDDYRNKELAAKEATFQVDLKEIREKVRPAIDDELAKSLGTESAEDLKKALTERLNDEVKQENDARAQRAVVEAIVAASTVDIPDTMIERERNLLLYQLEQYFKQSNQDWQAFEQSDEYAKVKETKLTEAKQRVGTSLVLGAVVRAEKLSVNENDIGPYLYEVMQRYNLTEEQVLKSDELRRQLLEDVLTSKVVELLLSKATVNYVPDQPHEHDENCSHGHEGAQDKKEEGQGKKKAELTGQKKGSSS